MKKVLYCWELGAGLGHVTRINAVCNRDEFSQTQFIFALREPDKAGYIDKAHDDNVVQASVAVVSKQFSSSPNYSHLLWRSGWCDINIARELIAAWIRLFEQYRPNYVFVDHSPTAVIAATILEIPILVIGNGFEIPPMMSPFPSIQPWTTIPRSDLVSSDKQLFNNLKQVISGKKNNKSRTLAEWLLPPKQLITVSPVLDHYHRESAGAYFFPMSTTAEQGKLNFSPRSVFSAKPRLFVYLNARLPNVVSLLRNLTSTFDVIGFIPGLAEADFNVLTAMGVQLAKKALNIEKVVADCDLVLCHGGIGTVSQALNANRAICVIPTHIEQQMLAFRLAERGLVVVLSKHDHYQVWTSVLNDVAASSHYYVQLQKLAIASTENKKNIWDQSITEFLQK